MSRIYGDKDAIHRAEGALAGDKSVYVNWDAIRELPDEFEVVITSVAYDPKNIGSAFSNVGSQSQPSWMPNPELMYKIAEACGISGAEESETAPIIEEVDINPMLCRPMDAEPTYRRMNVGRSVSKRSCRMMEDGTMIWSSRCTSEYNVWERCLELWSKEEQYTDGYEKPGRYENKYDSPYKRRAHFDSEMKFAHAKAETKAHLKTVRELAGLPTGFKNSDLTSGVMVFCRVRRSREALKMESAARLQAIASGTLQSHAGAMLFGPTQAPVQSPMIEAPAPQAVDADEPTIIDAYEYYASKDLIDESLKETADKTLEWLKSTPDYRSNERFYSRSIKNLQAIEELVPSEFRMYHNLY